MPGKKFNVEITDVYGREEAYTVIRRSVRDYHEKSETLQKALFDV